ASISEAAPGIRDLRATAECRCGIRRQCAVAAPATAAWTSSPRPEFSVRGPRSPGIVVAPRRNAASVRAFVSAIASPDATLCFAKLLPAGAAPSIAPRLAPPPAPDFADGADLAECRATPAELLPRAITFPPGQ